jgi:uncharacterized protein
MLASFVVLFLGPLVNAAFKGSHFVRDIIDGFTLVVIVLLVAMHILPHTVHDIGFWAIGMALIGLFLPSVFERLYKKSAYKVHRITLFIVLSGLCIHAFIDGIALIDPNTIHSMDSAHTQSMLPFAVILHRLPVGLAIWALVTPMYGSKRTILILLLMCIATVAGVSSGTYLLAVLNHEPFGFFEALVAGSLLHIMFHRADPHEAHSCHDHAHEEKKPKFHFKWATGFGAILGFVLIYIIQNPPGLEHAHHESTVFWNLAMISAPALVIAYICSGLINTFLPQSSINWMHKGSEIKQAVSGLLFGLPLPICSCGVVPIYRSLVKKGVPLSAGITFFVATPELGLDAILITIPLLGTQFTAIRLVAAAIVALFVGIIIGVFFKNNKTKTNIDEDANTDLNIDKKSIPKRIKTGMWIGLADMVDHTAPWIILGLAIAAAMQPYLQESSIFYSVPAYLQVPLFALLGLPIYVCASGITPFVAILLYHGVSPGAAIAFMLTGPATNITTFGILSQLHGRKLAITFAFLVMISAVSIGYVINFFTINIPQGLVLKDHVHYSDFRMVFLVLLLGIYAFSLLRCGPQAWAKKIISEDIPDDLANNGKNGKHACCHSH